jgi:hypothetical protein
MPVEVVWDNEDKSIIRYNHIDRWTLDEFFAAHRVYSRMMDSVDHNVYLIVNMSSAPPNYVPAQAIVAAKRSLEIVASHENYGGLTIFVQGKGFVEMIVNVVQKVNPRLWERMNVMFVASLDEARARINERRAKLQVPE